MNVKRKPMTVAAITEEPARTSTTAKTESRDDSGGGLRAHVKQLTVYLPHPVYRQLRELAFHEERRMHSLLLEGLDRVFADRGVRSTEELTRET